MVREGEAGAAEELPERAVLERRVRQEAEEVRRAQQARQEAVEAQVLQQAAQVLEET